MNEYINHTISMDTKKIEESFKIAIEAMIEFALILQVIKISRLRQNTRFE